MIFRRSFRNFLSPVLFPGREEGRGLESLTEEEFEEVLSRGGSFRTVIKRLAEAVDETEFKLEKILNNGITLGDNVSGRFIEVDVSDKSQEVRHGLGFEPSGFLVVWKDGPGEVYADRVTEWTKETLFLKSSATNQKVRLFVL